MLTWHGLHCTLTATFHQKHGIKKKSRAAMFHWPFSYTTIRNRKNLHLNFKSQQKNFLNWKLNLKFSASGSTRDTTLALSIESLPENRRRRERGLSECSDVVRPRSSINICDRAGEISHITLSQILKESKFNFRIWWKISTFPAFLAKCRISANVGQRRASVTLAHNSSELWLQS